VPETLTALDATLLELEELSEGATMNLGGVMVFDALPDGGAPSIEEVRALVAGRLSGLRGYRQRLSRERTGRWSWPRWTEDERFDIENHVSRAALPSPGGEAQLCDWIAAFYSHRLDRTRPLWEVILLEGLEGGCWALAHKLHHCLVDEIGAAGAAELMLDARQDAVEESSPGSISAASPEPLWRSLVPTPPRLVAQAAGAGGYVVRAALRSTVHPRRTLARSRRVAELLIEEEIVGAPRCSLNVRIGPTRRYAAVRCPLVDLTTISEGLEGTVSDAALAACATGLRRLLLERDEDLPPTGLRAMLPVNMNHAADGAAVGYRLVSLPVAEPNPLVRHRRIVEATRRQSGSGRWEAAGTVVDLAALAPPLVHASLARVLYGTRLANLAIATVHGEQRPRYAFGAQLREVHPIVPLGPDHAVGVGIFSQAGLAIFGISADCESMPDLAVLVLGVEEGIEELLGSLGTVRRGRRRGIGSRDGD
jgi:diacylglycerol O-acyltransferase